MGNSKNEREGPEGSSDIVKTLYSALRDLSKKVVMLQERLDDVLGLKECRSVWSRHAEQDAKLKSELKSRIDQYMASHSNAEAAAFLREKLETYYTRRIELSNALEKIGAISPQSDCIRIVVGPDKNGKTSSAMLDCNVVGEIRKNLSDMADVHVLLTNILKGSASPECLDDKSLCDEAYLHALANELSAPSGFFGTWKRFGELVEEIKSAERQIRKLESRVSSAMHTDEAENDKARLKELEECLEAFTGTPEAIADSQKLAAMLDFRDKHYPKGSSSAAALKLNEDIREQQTKVDSHLNTPEAKMAVEMVKEQRRRVRAHRNSPEAAAASALLEKRKSAKAALENRLSDEAVRFCRARNKILNAVAKATNDIATYSRDFPECVQDAFRNNPPDGADHIIATQYKLSYKERGRK